MYQSDEQVPTLIFNPTRDRDRDRSPFPSTGWASVDGDALMESVPHVRLGRPCWLGLSVCIATLGLGCAKARFLYHPQRAP